MILFCACNAETSQNSIPKPKETHTLEILALDLGKFNTMCCFFDTKTRKYSFLNAPTERNYLNTLFKNHKVDCVVMEACGPSGWINDLAISHGLKTLVCSTIQSNQTNNAEINGTNQPQTLLLTPYH